MWELLMLVGNSPVEEFDIIIMAKKDNKKQIYLDELQQASKGEYSVPFKDNKVNVTQSNIDDVHIDKNGNLVDLRTGRKGTAYIPEFTVIGNMPDRMAALAEISRMANIQKNEGLKSYNSEWSPESMTLPILPSLKYANGVLKNIKNRAQFAFANIAPQSYGNSGVRFIPYALDVLSGTPARVSRLKHPVYEDMLNLTKYVKGNYKNNANFTREGFGNAIKNMTTDARLDAWRKYLGLPEEGNFYIPNNDRTFKYNIPWIEKQYGLKFKPYPYDADDYITGNHGGIYNKVKELPEVVQKYIINGDEIQTRKQLGISKIRDVWDLQPFEDINNSIDKLVRNSAGKLYTSLYDKVGTKKDKFAYKYLGGKQLDKLRYEFDINNTKLAPVIDKIRNFEVGNILGGKPFTLSQEIPFTYEKPIKSNSERFGILKEHEFYKYGWK